MTLENEAPDDSEFITPDDPASEGNEDIEARNAEAEGSEAAEGEDNAGKEPGDENQEQAEGDDEFEDFEHSGKKYKLPKELKPLLMMQQDYTRKTQEVADQRRALEQYQARVQAEIAQQVETAKTFTREIAQLQSIDERLQQYAQADWGRLEQEDPLGAQRHWREYQMLKDQRENVTRSLQQKEHQARQEAERRSQEAQQAQKVEFAKRAEQTLHAVQKAVPGWNEKVAKQVRDYAASQGYSDDELYRATSDPRAFILLYRAMRGEQIESQQNAAAAKAKAQLQPKAAPLTPVAKGRSAPATAGLDDRLSADEWVRRRNEQLRNRG